MAHTKSFQDPALDLLIAYRVCFFGTPTVLYFSWHGTLANLRVYLQFYVVHAESGRGEWKSGVPTFEVNELNDKSHKNMSAT
jgi:hypothetical protein